MKIKKVLNNNAVIAINAQGEEIVVTGLGLAFKKKSGDELDKDKVERIFRMESKKINKKLIDLISEIPIDYIGITEEIIIYAKKKLGKKLNENIYLTLIDHISFAIQRVRNNISVTNPMIWEIKRFYMEEYIVGLIALQIIKDRLNIKLPNDEAASIAMHFVNAELNQEMPKVVNMIKILQDSLNIIKYHFGIDLEEDSLNYQRLVIHLKFFAQRIINSETYNKSDDYLFNVIKEQCPQAYECAKKIQKYAMEKYHFLVSKSEMSYLIVHIERIIHSQK